jgi:hypothetical protein
MRKQLLGSVFCVLVLAARVGAQIADNPAEFPALFAWTPPDPQIDDRPNVGPPGYQYYGRVDYLLLWAEKDRTVTGLAKDPAENADNLAVAGVGEFGAQQHSAGRAVFGVWLDSQQDAGIEIGGLGADQTQTGSHDATAAAAARSQFTQRFWDAEINYRGEVYRGDWAHFDLLAGFKYFSFDESLGIDERQLASDSVTSARFSGRNRFYGGQVGAETEWHRSGYFLDLWAKLALGDNCETLGVGGTTLEGGHASAGGLLAAPAISGSYFRNEFACLPELGVNVGYELGAHVRFTAGYTFIYLSNAARPGEEANALFAGPAPPFPFHASEVWIQGLNFGAEFRF